MTKTTFSGWGSVSGILVAAGWAFTCTKIIHKLGPNNRENWDPVYVFLAQIFASTGREAQNLYINWVPIIVKTGAQFMYLNFGFNRPGGTKFIHKLGPNNRENWHPVYVFQA